jgi:hypothetical protein
MKENWIVQIFKNTATSTITTASDESTFLRFCFASGSGSETASYNGKSYYPAVLNKPSISYSLDLKSFTTKTGNVNLNLANINLDGTTLLETLGDSYINGQVNILSQIDDDDTADNALQIFSGKVSSFGYRNNTIVMNIISSRPYQNVSLPQGKTNNGNNDQYNNQFIPVVYGEYEANTGFVNGQDVYACPFLRNDGKDFLYIIPEGTSATSEKLELYDKGMKRFVEITGMTDTSVGDTDGAKVLRVPKSMERQFKMLPDDIGSGNTISLVGSGVTLSSGSVANMYDGSSSTNGTISNTAGFGSESKGVVLKLIMPQVTGKITNITLGLTGTYSQTITGSPSGSDGAFFNLATSLSNSFGSSSGDVELVGTSSSGDKVDRTNAALPTSTDISGILDNNSLPDNLYLSFRFNAEGGNGDYSNFDVILKNVFLTVTAANDLANEPIASQEFNAGIDMLYLGRDVTSNSFLDHTTATEINNLDNPVSIHRELLHSILGVTDFENDTDISDSGFLTTAQLRDSNTANSSTHWKTRLQVYEQTDLEGILNQLQYEGCFFFEFSPQAQQTSITGVSPLRYFTIDNGNPTADVDLSQVDISDYELGITPVQDLETRLFVNFKKHPAENQYLKQVEYNGSTHSTIFDNANHQKQEISLDFLYDSIDDNGTERNDDFINFRSSLFGDYKTTVNTTIINPEKYAMLQVGDIIDFGEILFSELGSPFDEISDTFDSFVAMPTRLFNEAWSNKKFIITNLKRKIGSISIQCREVSV